MLERKLWRSFDFTLLIIVLAISALSLITIMSATVNNVTGDPMYFVQRQAIWLAVGIVAMFIVLSVDYSYFAKLSLYFYVVNIGLLTTVLFIGKEKGGAQRWIDLKFFELQPSELAKLIIIITLAKLLAEKEGDFESVTDLAIPFLHVGLPMVLIFLQPDLGTSLVFFSILFSMLFMIGAPVKYLLGTIALGVGVGFPLLWKVLKPYQRMRLIVFANPEIDPMGYGYQLLQSMIAIGSGGTTGYFFREGKLFQGTQSRLNFLPEQHTDFIFSVLGEEFGFLGGSLLILLFFFLIYRILIVAKASKDTFGTLICIGVAAMFIFQVLVNIGMTVSIMPVTGLPLPFMSYGGSAFLINMMSIGLVLNVGMRRHKILF